MAPGLCPGAECLIFERTCSFGSLFVAPLKNISEGSLRGRWRIYQKGRSLEHIQSHLAGELLGFTTGA